MRALLTPVLYFCAAVNAYAQATTAVAGGPLYGGPSQAFVMCYALNNGFDTNIDAHIVDQKGNQLTTFTFKDCSTGTITPSGASCAIAAAISNNQAYSCSFTAGVLHGNIPNIRGTIEIVDKDVHVLATSLLK
jgi:hypothetical protein